MGLFKKKPDPIAERAKALNDRIAALEEEIQKLALQKEPPAHAEIASHSPFAAVASASSSVHGHPRLRSTARPRGAALSPASAPPPEPVLEEVHLERSKPPGEALPRARENDLGVRRNGLSSAWERLKSQFRGPVASNPKLVHYLSAGSIQGLRPLRYEKRVARNRFIALAVFLVVVLGGIISVFLSRR